MHKIHLNLKSFDLNSLKKTENYLFSVFSFLNLNQIQQKSSPKNCKKITVLRSPHIDKKSREQFQRITHKKSLSSEISDKNKLLFVLKIIKNSQLRGVEIEMVVDYSTF